MWTSLATTNVRLLVLCPQLLLTAWTGQVTITILPDDVLLHIFHLHRMSYLDGLELFESQFDAMWSQIWQYDWHRLVHVCQRWRSLVFSLPNFLDLRLVCLPWTSVELTTIWPPLPTLIRNMVDWPMPEEYDFDTAMIHHNHVYEIDLFLLTSLQLQRLASAMQEQFPALTHLLLESAHDTHPVPALPDGFLGGSAPRLQSLELHSVPFLALPKLLLSATDLVYLTLWNIPHSGYIPAEAIVTGLAVMANLKSLTIAFESPRSYPNWRPPPPTRIVLPALIRFGFHGVFEYLEDLMARIDTPVLDSIRMNFLNDLTFDLPQLAQFMRRTTRFQELNEANVIFDDGGVRVEPLQSRLNFETSRLRISCRGLDWQLLSLAQVITSFIPSIYMVEQLYIYVSRYSPSRLQDDIENMQWQEIFRPFTAVKNLFVCKEFAPCIAPTVKDLSWEGLTDVLPALESIFLGDVRVVRLQRPLHDIEGATTKRRALLIGISYHNSTDPMWGPLDGPYGDVALFRELLTRVYFIHLVSSGN